MCTYTAHKSMHYEHLQNGLADIEINKVTMFVCEAINNHVANTSKRKKKSIHVEVNARRQVSRI